MRRRAFLFSQSALSALTFCLLISLVGCGASKAPSVHGKVTLDGDSVTLGNISFYSLESKGPKAAAAIENGAYAISPQDNLVPGKYRVQISWRKPTGRTIPSADPGMTTEETREAIPAKYNTESTLVAEIGSGDTEKDFALTTK